MPFQTSASLGILRHVVILSKIVRIMETVTSSSCVTRKDLSMGFSASRLTGWMFHTAEAVGHPLWRRQPNIHRANAAQQGDAATTAWGIYSTTVVHAAWQAACDLRGAVARPQWDRSIGSAWDRARPDTGTSKAALPGRAAADRLEPARGPACDLDRYDLGRWHKAAACKLGGSDAAVLATHVPLFVVRMARHGVIGVVTGAGLLANALRGRLVWPLGRSCASQWERPACRSAPLINQQTYRAPSSSGGCVGLLRAC